MKFGYTILYVRDVSATIGFYEAAFGMKRRFLHEGGDYGELDTGSTTLAFASIALATTNLKSEIQAPKLEQPPQGSEIAFVTDNVPEAYKMALSVGAVGVAKPALKPWGQTVAYVRDLDGHLIELCSAIQSG
jgi:lactoylglutathione lyase